LAVGPVSVRGDQEALHVGTNAGTDSPIESPAEAVTVRYEIGADEPPSHALVTVLSGLTGADPTRMGPLSQHVDLEALDELLATDRRDAPWTTSVRLALDSYAVSIHSSEIVVAELPRGDRPADRLEGP
jgi:hypothetical protein